MPMLNILAVLAPTRSMATAAQTRSAVAATRFPHRRQITHMAHTATRLARIRSTTRLAVVSAFMAMLRLTTSKSCGVSDCRIVGLGLFHVGMGHRAETNNFALVAEA